MAAVTVDRNEQQVQDEDEEATQYVVVPAVYCREVVAIVTKETLEEECSVASHIIMCRLDNFLEEVVTSIISEPQTFLQTSKLSMCD